MKNKNLSIKEKLESTGLKKSFVAKKIGTTLTQLSLHINGKRDLPIETEERLKKFLAERAG